jgi:hypothetical protein
MRTKDKMKDSDAEFKEWWELAKEYFTKELEKNMVQHRANERNLRYKLEIYYNFFPEFVYGNPTSRETLSQDEEVEVGPSAIVQEEEM